MNINEQKIAVDAAPETPLLRVLRDHIGLTGTKFGCSIAQSCACTVHIDGVSTRSCQVPLSSLDGVQITMIEALSPDGTHPLQKVWVEMNVRQCGYCQTGMLMTAE